MDFVKVGKDYEWFTKWFLMSTLTNGICLGLDKIYKYSSLEMTNEGQLKVDCNIPIYSDDFS